DNNRARKESDAQRARQSRIFCRCMPSPQRWVKNAKLSLPLFQGQFFFMTRPSPSHTKQVQLFLITCFYSMPERQRN
ncbi:hypothetical protein ACLBP3_28810, partial [Klebsiella pneumoniae]|uniref:hypothetical protein n=1 Tax=Klebsiella pneumoniae TaxID=573 RepID=UPI00396B7351